MRCARADTANGEPERVIYDFFINADNVHLQRFLKYEMKSGEDDKVAKSRFELGMMLTGLALIYEDRLGWKQAATNPDSQESEPKEPVDLVGEVDRHHLKIAPVQLLGFANHAKRNV